MIEFLIAALSAFVVVKTMHRVVRARYFGRNRTE